MRSGLILSVFGWLALVHSGPLRSDPAGLLTSFDELLWQHRVVLVWSQNADSIEAQFEQNRDEIEDRDIVWFLMGDRKLKTNYRDKVSRRFQQKLINQSGFNTVAESSITRLVLIGKDGGIKMDTAELDANRSIAEVDKNDATYEQGVNLARLFSRIDAMPMRQREMRSSER